MTSHRLADGMGRAPSPTGQLRDSDKHPPTNSTEALEAIARIIDPSNWRVLDGYLRDVQRIPNAGYDPDNFKDKASMAKAQAILEALASTYREENANLLLQAQSWKMEAACHKSSLHEAYQAVTGATGEPGNWNGAKPIIEALDRLREENARLREGLERAEAALERIAHPEYGLGFSKLRGVARAYFRKAGGRFDFAKQALTTPRTETDQ